MNVLIVTVLSNKSTSGVVTYYTMLAEDLRSQGLAVRIIDIADTPLLWQKVLGLLRRVASLLGPAGRAFYNDFAWFTSIYLATRLQKMPLPDLIHAQDATAGIAAYKALEQRVPIMLTCHFNDDPASELATRFGVSPWAARQLKKWYTYLLSYIKHYVFVSHYAYSKSKQLLPPDASIIVLHNTVRLASLAGATSRDGAGKLIISNVGYIDERKNQKLLIQIADELRKLGSTNFEIWLIGEGPKRPEYEQLADELKLTGHVKFYGRQADPWRWVARTDLYVHTALNDNCPYSIIEAFAVKTPVLALPVGGIPEMLPTRYGLLHGTDPKALAGEIAGYFDAEKRRQLLEAQSAYADVNFNHRKSLTKLISFYHQTEQAA